jgi:putative hydrolase of the HAD superfamily
MPNPIWLFDLDNTLHDASHRIFPIINRNMSAYVAATLARAGLPADAASADALRHDYWQRYGATLLGMVRHHQVRAADFLQAAHQFDDLAGLVQGERGLRALLQRLPGRKVLLTNAPRAYARQVLRRLGLQHQFERQITIETMRVHGQWRPKPAPQLLRRLLARQRHPAGACILIDDTLAVLKSAKALGLHTVWMTGYLAAQPGRCGRNPRYVDVKIKSIRKLSGNLHRLR